jgi:hypothetical protein
VEPTNKSRSLCLARNKLVLIDPYEFGLAVHFWTSSASESDETSLPIVVNRERYGVNCERHSGLWPAVT